MEPMQSVRFKVYRAKQHFDELSKELNDFLARGPGEIGEMKLSTPEYIAFEGKEDLPARIPLICGDALQNLRSSLDYLIWELVLAEGNTPDRMNAFPIALTEEAYKDDVKKRKRLNGVSQEAQDLIRSFQPFNCDDPNQHPLAILDELTNINKHRRILFATLTGSVDQPGSALLQLRTRIKACAEDGSVLGEMPFWIYVTIDDGAAKGTEITALLDILTSTVGDQVLSSFGLILDRK